MDDEWLMMEESTESTESTESFHWWMMVESKERDILTRNVYETFLSDIWQDILTRHIDGLWQTLLTCNDL